MQVTARKTSVGVTRGPRDSYPSHPFWLVRGFFHRDVTVRFDHPTDSRFVTEVWIEIPVGTLKVATLPGSELFSISLMQVRVETYPRDGTRPNSYPPTHSAVHRLDLVGARDSYANGIWSNVVGRRIIHALHAELFPTPDLEWDELQALARAAGTEAPPGVLVDWLREAVPEVEKVIAQPPLPQSLTSETP